MMNRVGSSLSGLKIGSTPIDPFTSSIIVITLTQVNPNKPILMALVKPVFCFSFAILIKEEGTLLKWRVSIREWGSTRP